MVHNKDHTPPTLLFSRLSPSPTALCTSHSLIRSFHSKPSNICEQLILPNMGEWQEQMMGFDVEDVLSQLSQNEKIALLSGKLPCLVRG